MSSHPRSKGAFLEDRFGEPFQFLPIYHELRTDVREAIRLIERAQETDELWSRTDAPEYGKWKKHKEAIATNPWAALDSLHGPLEEAFDHVERLSTKTCFRFGASRQLQDTDDADVALKASESAEEGLTRSIDRLENLQRVEP